MQQWYQKHRKNAAILYGIIYVISGYMMLLSYIPREITITGEEQKISLAAPVSVEQVHQKQTVAVGQEKSGVGSVQKYHCKLFGIIPLGTIEATVKENQCVNAVGVPVGIYLKMQSVYVAGTKEIKNTAGDMVNPGAYVVKEGDYVVAAQGKKVSTKEQLQEMVTNCQGQSMVLTLLRNHEYMDVRLQPVKTSDGSYKLGLWVKDDMAGVGTVTYTKSDGSYGALGHGISDSGTGKLLLLEHGFLYHASITNITPSSIGSPGELTGLISYGIQSRFGDVTENSEVGIYGEMAATGEKVLGKRSYPVGYKQEIKRAPATMLFGEEGNVKSYGIEIQQINYSPKEKNKAFVFQVTDKELIEKTGGIVQGMSGSPIVQDGKIIGAVTHVFVNDPTRGYGIFIESMLER